MNVTWNDLYNFLHQYIQENKNFGEKNCTVYAAGRGEYFPVDSISLNDDDVLDPDSVILVIQD